MARRHRSSGYDGFGGYGELAPYTPVGMRKANGARAVTKITQKLGRAADPVQITGRQITTTFWGKAWCENLERYSDFANRLPRGRTYVRNGSVLDLHISEGRVDAHVAGSELYTVSVALTRLSSARWQAVIASCASRIGSLIGLLRGELDHDVLSVLTQRETGLFPAPPEVKLECSCPDGAYMCKHLAAVLYGVGARLDQRPELFFVLRQVDQAELIGGALSSDVMTAAGARTASTGKRRIAESELSSVFGIELDEEPVHAAMSTAEKTVGSKKKVPIKKLGAKATGTKQTKRGPKKASKNAAVGKPRVP